MTEITGFKMEQLRIGIYNTFEPVYHQFIDIVIVEINHFFTKNCTQRSFLCDVLFRGYLELSE